MHRVRASAVGLAAFSLIALSSVSARAQQAPFSWTGLYFGINAGYSRGSADTSVQAFDSTRTRIVQNSNSAVLSDSTVTTTNPVSGDLSSSLNGWLGGIQLGQNWQFNGYVLGIETDFQGTSERGSVGACSASGCGTGTTFVNINTKLDWFGTVRARAGVLLTPDFLLFATVGLAYGHVTTDYAMGVVGTWSGAGSTGETRAGFVLGGGGEWRLDRNWLLRAEYLRIDLGQDAGILGSGGTTTTVRQEVRTFIFDQTTSIEARTKLVDDIFRIALSYKLN